MVQARGGAAGLGRNGCPARRSRVCGFSEYGTISPAVLDLEPTLGKRCYMLRKFTRCDEAECIDICK